MPTDYLVSMWGKSFFQPAVEDKDLTAPPGSPVKAKRYIVGGSATGAWSGHDNDIAMYTGAVWVFATPKEGWFVYVKDEDTFYLYTTSWAEFSAGGGIGSLVEDTSPQLGGDLDLNSKKIDFPSVADISDVKDEDDMVSDSPTMLATQQSIKAYVDAGGGGAVSPRTSEKKTDNYTVDIDDGGKTIEMTAGGEKTFTLPACSTAGKGFWVKFVKGDASKLNIDPVGADKIADGGANDPIYNNESGEAGYADITLEVDFDEGVWLIVSAHGTWITTD